ncbi:hypothetical protein LUZ60_016564 [Juncus effusus]|nr:hypothetical protein LUZ60_016564 [Juncus effusus]
MRITPLIFLHFLLIIIQAVSSQKIQDPLLIDEIIRDAALISYHSKRHQKTAVHYNISLPSSIYGVSAETVRYRTGSLRRYGATFNEFTLPSGIFTHPHVKHVLLVQQNLGNLSLIYNQYFNGDSRFQLVSPVLGLLFYKAFHTSPISDINILVSKTPILVNFSEIVEAELKQRPKCVVFQLDGNISVTDEAWDDVCITWQQGHFALMAEEMNDGTGTDGETGTRVNKWKVVVLGAMAGTAGTIFIGLLVIALMSVRRKKILMAEMERRAYEEEALHVSMVGHVRAPTATGARTKPVLENAYVPGL